MLERVEKRDDEPGPKDEADDEDDDSEADSQARSDDTPPTTG
jgi:hypothetical protein